MNGELAQYIALATWGTIGLRDGAAAASGLGTANDAFRFTRRLEFEGVGAADAWLASLAARGVERVWLAVDPSLLAPAPDGKSTWQGRFAFVNGMNGRGGLLAGSDMWRGRQSEAAVPGPDNRIWDVAYEAVPAPMRPMAPPLGDAMDRLERALRRAADFARAHPELGHWQAVFAEAAALGRADGTEPPYSHNLFPRVGYPAASRRLAAMAHAAWVFGGMGSWNDMGFEASQTEREFQSVTGELFSGVLFATLAAVNSPLTL